MLFNLIQMQVITSEVYHSSAYDICKLYNSSFIFKPESNHTRFYTPRNLSDPDLCTYAGKRDQYDLNMGVERANYYRGLAGLSPIGYSKSEKLLDEMKKAALMLYSNSKWTPTGWNKNHRCFTEEGKIGLESSTTSKGNYEMVFARDIKSYIEYGSPYYNELPRRSLLNPKLPAIAGDALDNGIAVRYKNFYDPEPTNYKDPVFVAFPPPGYYAFECRYFGFCSPLRRWYLQLRDYPNPPNDSVVSVECDGWNNLKSFTIYNESDGLKGSYAFDLKDPYVGQECVVSVKSASADKEWRYTVKPIDCSRPLPKEPVEAIVDGHVVTNGGITGLFFGYIFVAAIALAVGFFFGRKRNHDDEVVKMALV